MNNLMELSITTNVPILNSGSQERGWLNILRITPSRFQGCITITATNQGNPSKVGFYEMCANITSTSE